MTLLVGIALRVHQVEERSDSLTVLSALASSSSLRDAGSVSGVSHASSSSWTPSTSSLANRSAGSGTGAEFSSTQSCFGGGEINCETIASWGDGGDGGKGTHCDTTGVASSPPTCLEAGGRQVPGSGLSGA
eukprot:849677-Rhodomonas_salina.3